VDAPESLVVSKELSFYYDPASHSELLGAFVHVFLVRDPAATIESLYRASTKGGTTYFDADETGFAELERAVVHAHDVLGVAHPCVISSDDLVEKTEETIRKICAYADVPFDDAMLSWEGGRQVKAWEKWEGWHGDTMASSKFEKTQHAKVDFPKEVADAIEKQTPTYARILAWRDGFEASILSAQ